MNNRPSGGGMYSNYPDDKDVWVGIGFDDTTVSLKKTIEVKDGKKKVVSGVYRLTDDTFSGFGASVPDLISAAINMDEINIQEQLDRPYLVTSSAGEISRVINYVTQLEMSDKILSLLGSDIRTASTKQKLLLEDAAGFQIDIDKLAILDDLTKVVEEFYEVERKLVFLDEDLRNIMFVRDNLIKQDAYISGIDNNLIDAEYDYERACDYSTSLYVANQVASIVIEYMDDSDAVAAKPFVDIAVDALGTFETILEKANHIKEFYVLFEILETSEYNILSMEDEMSQQSEALSNRLKELKLCPFCYGRIDAKSIDRIVESVCGTNTAK
jgi:hypothetical protein